MHLKNAAGISLKLSCLCLLYLKISVPVTLHVNEKIRQGTLGYFHISFV